jgi:Flp pilus assembly protein TadD
MDRSNNTRRTVAICALLGLLTLAVFAPVLQNDFVEYDDQDYVTANPQVQQGVSWEGVRWAFGSAHFANWIPFTWLSHMLDCQLFGLHPGWHHLTSLILHTASTLLLFLVLKRMTAASLPSAFVALLFALHPLHVESVAWVSERKDVLSGFFFCLTLLAYALYTKSKVERQNSEVEAMQRGGKSADQDLKSEVELYPPSSILHPHSSRWYWLAVAFFALGLLSKPMLVTLPFVLLLLDYWPLRRFEIKSQESQIANLLPLLREKVPFFVLALAASIITFKVQQKGGAMVLMESVPLKLRLANAAVSCGRYLLNAIWPTDLAAFYPMPPAWPGWVVAVSLLVLCALTGLALRHLRTLPYLGVGWFWFLGTLVPVIGIVQVGIQSMADRYTYIPLIGIFIIVAFGIKDLMERQPEWRLALGVVGGMVVSICALLTVNQAIYWRKTETLFEHALAVTSNNSLAEYSVGVAQVREGRYAEAYSHFAEAVRIKPDYGEAHNNLGLLLVMNGKLDEGIAHYRQALDAKSDTPELHFNLATALLAKGELNEAANECRNALKAKPAFSAAGLQLAGILGKQGKLTEARTQYEATLKSDGENADAHFGLGLLMMQTGKLEEAVNEFRQLLRLRSDAQAHYNLALILSLQGNSGEALEHYRAAVRLQPSWPAALNDLAWVLATDPKPEHRNGAEAIELARKACELSEHKEPRYLGTLDACYAEAGRFDEAIATAKETETLASHCGQKDIAAAAAARRKLYESKQPYHQDSDRNKS